MTRWKSIREAISLAADLLEFRDVPIVASATAALSAAAHYGLNWPLFPVLLLAALLMLLGVLLIAFVRATRGIDRWRGHASYTVWIAAWLLIDSPPRSARIDAQSPAYPSLQLIKNAIISGTIKPIAGTGDMKSTIAVRDLRMLAKVYGGKTPKFLTEES